MSHELTVPIIGYLHSPLHEKFGVPRQPNLVPVHATVEFIAPYDVFSACQGLEAFSHLWLIWQFHQIPETTVFKPSIRPPRLGGNAKIGVFASRSMFRPSRLGLSVVKIVSVINDNGKTKLTVSGADLIDGTPIVDIKPYLHYADAIMDASSSYAQLPPVSLVVEWSLHAHEQKNDFVISGELSTQAIVEIEQLLSLDPRPAYQEDSRIYGMCYAPFNIRFQVKSRHVKPHDQINTIFILDITKK